MYVSSLRGWKTRLNRLSMASLLNSWAGICDGFFTGDACGTDSAATSGAAFGDSGADLAGDFDSHNSCGETPAGEGFSVS